MSVGDEIVTIGDTPVCTSTYQEICDLMHNLPITLTLEIKKPVSGEKSVFKNSSFFVLWKKESHKGFETACLKHFIFE